MSTLLTWTLQRQSSLVYSGFDATSDILTRLFDIDSEELLADMWRIVEGPEFSKTFLNYG